MCLRLVRGNLEKKNLLCVFEREIQLPYSFYEDLLQQENILKKRFVKET